MAHAGRRRSLTTEFPQIRSGLVTIPQTTSAMPLTSCSKLRFSSMSLLFMLSFLSMLPCPLLRCGAPRVVCSSNQELDPPIKLGQVLILLFCLSSVGTVLSDSFSLRTYVSSAGPVPRHAIPSCVWCVHLMCLFKRSAVFSVILLIISPSNHPESVIHRILASRHIENRISKLNVVAFHKLDHKPPP